MEHVISFWRTVVRREPMTITMKMDGPVGQDIAAKCCRLSHQLRRQTRTHSLILLAIVTCSSSSWFRRQLPLFLEVLVTDWPVSNRTVRWSSRVLAVSTRLSLILHFVSANRLPPFFWHSSWCNAKASVLQAICRSVLTLNTYCLQLRMRKHDLKMPMVCSPTPRYTRYSLFSTRSVLDIHQTYYSLSSTFLCFASVALNFNAEMSQVVLSSGWWKWCTHQCNGLPAALPYSLCYR